MGGDRIDSENGVKLEHPLRLICHKLTCLSETDLSIICIRSFLTESIVVLSSAGSFLQARSMRQSMCRDVVDHYQHQPEGNGAVLLKDQITHHYDELSPYYRDMWGVHIHHGYWKTGLETKEEAQEQLINELISRARIAKSKRILDVGCGLGGTALYLNKQRSTLIKCLVHMCAGSRSHLPKSKSEMISPSRGAPTFGLS